jgi:RNA polymerase sigma factor (sigma-70 family)
MWFRVASDEHLVARVRAGSAAAFEALFDRHQRSLLAFCRHMLGSTADAEDAVQHTFMAAYADLMRSERPIALRPWLYSIARHRCLSVLRARRERPVAELPEPEVDHLAAEVDTREELRATLNDIARLPDDQRAALVLAEMGDASHAEIAQILGCRQEKVKALVFQARSALATGRTARDTPCADIREQLALGGRAMRRTSLRRHVRDCDGCREFGEQLRRQRRRLRILLPAAPGLGLKRAVLGALGTFGGGGAVTGVSGVTAVVGALGVTGVAATAIAAVALAGGDGLRGATATAVDVRARPALAASARIERGARRGAPAAPSRRPEAPSVTNPRGAGTVAAPQRAPEAADHAGSSAAVPGTASTLPPAEALQAGDGPPAHGKGTTPPGPPREPPGAGKPPAHPGGGKPPASPGGGKPDNTPGDGKPPAPPGGGKPDETPGAGKPAEPSGNDGGGPPAEMPAGGPEQHPGSGPDGPPPGASPPDQARPPR